MIDVMSYHCGMGEGMRRFGYEPCDPHIVCDGCGLTRYITRLRSGCTPATWFMKGRAAPGGWQGGAVLGTTQRIDLCPACATQKQENNDDG